jgi:hypothetical protein
MSEPRHRLSLVPLVLTAIASACAPDAAAPPDAPEAECPVFYEDLDGDGHGNPLGATASCVEPRPLLHVATGDDCDDTDRFVYPGSAELCDGLDNDCDGVLETECPSGCAVMFRVPTQQRYLLCNEALTWDEARSICLSAGFDLVHVTDGSENAALRSAITSTLAPGSTVYLGGRVVGSSGWKWFDDNQMFWSVSRGSVWGAVVPGIYFNWDFSDPSAWRGGCLFMNGSGTWVRTDCSTARPFICERE